MCTSTGFYGKSRDVLSKQQHRGSDWSFELAQGSVLYWYFTLKDQARKHREIGVINQIYRGWSALGTWGVYGIGPQQDTRNLRADTRSRGSGCFFLTTWLGSNEVCRRASLNREARGRGHHTRLSSQVLQVLKPKKRVRNQTCYSSRFLILLGWPR